MRGAQLRRLAKRDRVSTIGKEIVAETGAVGKVGAEKLLLEAWFT